MVVNLVGLELSVPTLIWTLINFFVLMFLLNRFLFKPVIRFMDDRKARIDEDQKKRADAQKSYDVSEEKVKNELSKTNAEAINLVQQARNDAESVRVQAVKEAKRKALGELEDSRNRLVKESEASEKEIDEKMPEYVELVKNSLLKK